MTCHDRISGIVINFFLGKFTVPALKISLKPSFKIG